MKATVFDFLCSALVNSKSFFAGVVGRIFFMVVMVVSGLIFFRKETRFY